MHRALEVQEILLNIFDHFSQYQKNDLAALVRTCRAFKEPALDILWSDLNDLSALSRCLPEISCQSAFSSRRDNSTKDYKKLYGFRRPPEQAEWDVLQSYTRRTWRIYDFGGGLDWSSFSKAVVDLPAVDVLFPNLRYLKYRDFIDGKEAIPFLQKPFPSLISLDICLSDRSDQRNTHILRDHPLRSFAKFSPNIRELDITDCVPQPDPMFSRMVFDCICHWQNLQAVYFYGIDLNMDILVHLSRMPRLVTLVCWLGALLADQIVSSNSLLFFPTLNRLEVRTDLLATISTLLSRIQLPIVARFRAIIKICPSKQDLAFFMTGVQASGIGHTLRGWSLVQHSGLGSPPDIRGPEALVLTLEDIRPCMSFRHLRTMELDLEWNVGLTDDEILSLASAWPRLNWLLINEWWGWNTSGGITPAALAALLKRCPSLWEIVLAIDTRGYTRPPPNQSSLACKSRRSPFTINVIDSRIEEESLPAMVTFLAGIVPDGYFKFDAWDTWAMKNHYKKRIYSLRWECVHEQVKEAVKKEHQDLLG